VPVIKVSEHAESGKSVTLGVPLTTGLMVVEVAVREGSAQRASMMCWRDGDDAASWCKCPSLVSSLMRYPCFFGLRDDPITGTVDTLMGELIYKC
jgi:hypothetical protein